MRLRIIGTALLLLLLAAPVMAEPLVIKLSSSANPGTSSVLANRYLGKLIEERSGGRIRVEQLTPPLASPAAYLHELHSQQIELCLYSSELLSNDLPQLQLLKLPFLFQGRQHLYQVLDSELGEKIFWGTEKKGFITLTFWDRGFRQLATDRALLFPQQANELTVAAQSGRITAKQGGLKQKGETPVVAIQDAELAQISQLPEVQDFSDLTLSNHAVSGELLLANKTFWKQLPRDLQVIISGAVKDATRYARELSVQQEEQQLQQLEATARLRIHRLTAGQRDRWREMLLEQVQHELDEDTQHLMESILNMTPAQSTRN